MNVKEYIQSGIVESYVLGMATDAERMEFEQLCADYPEIVEARDAFERLLEEQSLRDAVVPPAFIREKVVSAIATTNAEYNAAEEREETPVRQINPWKWVAAASFLLVAGVAFWAFTTNKKYNDLLANQTTLQGELKESVAQLQILQQDADMLHKPGMKMVALKGTDVAPQAYTTVYWDTSGTNKDVYLLINNLPQPTTDKQYQLWALMEGKPIDLGVFDYDVKQKRLLVKMQHVQKAQAFAITLEKKGGNPTPAGSMYVMGNL